MRLSLDSIEARASEADRKRVCHLFHLLCLPFDMEHFPELLDCLDRLLTLTRRTWTLELRRSELEWMPSLVSNLKALFPSDPTKLLPLRQEGVKVRFPLYAGLIEPCLIENDSQRAKFDLLLAHALLATIEMMRQVDSSVYEMYANLIAEDEEDIFPFDPYCIWLTARDIANAAPGSEGVLNLLRLDLSPRRLAGNCRISVESEPVTKKGKSLSRWLDNIAAFLEGAYDLRDRREVGSRSSVGEEDDPNFYFGEIRMDPPFVGDRTRAGRRLSIKPPPGGGDGGGHGKAKGGDGSRGGNHGSGENDKRREWRRAEALFADNCPEEDEEEGLDVFSGMHDSEQFEKDPESYRKIMHAMRHQVVRENKHFAFGYERLTFRELAIIEVDCRRELKDLLEEPSLSPDMWSKTEDLALLLAILWLGKGRAPDVEIVNSELDNPTCRNGLIVPADGAPATFRMRVEFPVYKTRQDDVPGNRESYPYVLLPDYYNLSSLLLKLRNRRRREQGIEKGAPDRVFPDGRAQLIRLKAILEQKDPIGKRITLCRVSSAFSGYILSRTGNDVVAAKMITGFDSRISRVPMFYACRSQENINLIFHSSVTWILQEIRKERKDGSELPTARSGPRWKSRYIAKRLCPTVETVQKGVARLLTRLRDRATDPNCYHDLFMLYTSVFFGYGTLIRGIRDPLVSPNAISSLTNMALIRDKTSDSGDKAKYVYIPERLATQLEYLAEHLQRMDMKDLRRTFFFFKPGGGFEGVHPRTIEARLRDFLPFPPAVHRRFSFNALIEYGCPPEVVRVCMGHSTIGDEPWSGLSSFSYARYRFILAPYLDRLLTTLGFIPISSQRAE